MITWASVQTRNVKGLGWRGEHQQPVDNRGINIWHRDMGVAGIDQIVVNFIGQQDQIVAFGEISDALQLFPGPDAATGVMR